MSSLTLTDDKFEMFKKLVYDESGICFNSINRVILESRINENIRQKSLSSYEDYYKLLQTNKDELKNFLDSVTTNLTKFFRNQAHFESLKKSVLPEIVERKKREGNKTLRIWSAGCSTGEEPYSVAITALEEPKLKDWNIKIYASDLSLKSLVIAKEGKYTKDKVDKLDKALIEKYFNVVADDYIVKDTVKRLITFDYHNLKHRSSFSNLDIIICRNVIIYFDAEAQKKTVDRFYDALNAEGYLYIGHSESLFGMNTEFAFNKLGGAIVYTKGNIKHT